ncbi:hypothetical protein QOZ80_3AG0229300 [Eleusine coracana subsp. coracana]|nr:hypothetical protein QOZ80_3AG0229300 [Eleusine coracana subsp. coracana]
MDPIMKLLEDDEDESLHSGADVEAFTAALNREVEASASSSSASATSSSQPTTDQGSGLLSQENNSSLSHDHGQWQDSVKCEIENQQSQQQEHTLSHPGKDHSSRPEVISKGSNSEHLHSKTPKECDSPKVEQEPGTSAPQSGIVAQQQSVNQMKSQQPPGSNQTNSAITMVKPPVVTFHMLIPILRRHLDKDRDMQVQSIFAKLRKNEISKEHFLKVVRSIVGDKLLKQAASQYQMRHAALAQRNPKTNPSNSTVSNQVSVQPNVSSCPMPGGQMPDGKGIHMLQSCPPNIHSVQAQPMRHHVQHLQAPSPVFGTNNFHARPFPRPVGGSVALLRPQMVDSSQRAQLVQGAVTTIAGGVPTRPSMPGIVPINQSARHHLGNKEQRTNSSTSTAHTNMETISQQSDATTNSIPAMHAQQINPALGSSKGGIVMEHQSPSSSQTHQSHATKAEPKMQVQSSVQASAPAASKTPQKKASSGQKKALETLGSSPPPSSKKQKTSGGFHDQSIDQLNDVTAVSGVNLREEEEQLFSAPKEESRVSEAARKVVQLEEEKLILRKGPLTKKLADIMRKCNLKVIGTDVEHCLSMCVEERLRGFISNVIRLSKQRVDVEKSRHRFYPLSSDVRSHIMRVNREAREQWDKKQAEDAERIRKQNDVDGNANVDSEKDKNEARATSKHAKTFKDIDDKMRTTAANAAARVAAGGYDMLSKWQMIAERNKQKSEGGDGSSGYLPDNMLPHKPSPRSGKDSREQQEIEKRGYSTMIGSDGVRRSPVMKVARSITVKDVIATLEREPQMSKSSLLFQLYEKSSAESAPK